MIETGTVITLAVTLLGGGGLVGALNWWSSRRTSVVEMATSYVEMVSEDLSRYRNRIEQLELEVLALKAELEEAKAEIRRRT